MGLFEHFPYTNLHEMNLDWLLIKTKDLETAVEKLKDGVEVNSLRASYNPADSLIKLTYANEDAAKTGNVAAIQVGNQIAEVADQYARDEARTPKGYTRPEVYGAVGDGVNDDSVAVQQALDSGLNVLFTKGKKYLITNCKIPSDTHVLGYGAVICSYTTGACSFMNQSDGVNGVYNANRNITIEGLAFQFAASPDGWKNSLTGIAIAHSRNVKILNCYFSGLGNWHYIELNSSRDCEVAGCTFDGYGNAPGTAMSEMLQIDAATDSGNFPHFGPYDNTPSLNIEIHACNFIGTPEMVTDWNTTNGQQTGLSPAGIGNHRSDSACNTINIHDNYFSNLKCAIYFWNVNNSSIHNNIINECESGIYYMSASSLWHNIHDNLILHSYRAAGSVTTDTTWRRAISIPAGTQQVKITGNHIAQMFTSIVVEGSTSVDITGNTCRQSERGVYVTGSAYYITIKDNVLIANTSADIAINLTAPASGSWGAIDVFSNRVDSASLAALTATPTVPCHAAFNIARRTFTTGTNWKSSNNIVA